MASQASPAAQHEGGWLMQNIAGADLSIHTLALPVLILSILFVLGPALLGKSNLSQFPDVTENKSKFGMNLEARKEFLLDVVSVLKKGFKKAGGNDKPFRIASHIGEMVILPVSWANIIRNVPELSFMAYMKDQFLVDIPGMEAFKEGTTSHVTAQVVKAGITPALNKVTEPLTQEASEAIQELLGDNKEWHEIVLKQKMVDLVARMSARVFLGDKGAKNPDWLSITKDHTVDAFRANGELLRYPAPLRPIVHWFMPSFKKIRGQVTLARKVANEVLESRKAEKQAFIDAGLEPPEFNDGIEWFAIANAGDKTVAHHDLALQQLDLAFAAIHTTSDLISTVMYDIAKHPEIIKPLRDEIVAEIGHGGWKKTSLYNLKLMDSVLKESQRMKPSQDGLNMTRKATSDVTLENGVVIPKGTRLGVATLNMNANDSVHKNYTEWDPYRFYNLRQNAPGWESKAQLAATSLDHLAFGHGLHSCPGRFFAANEAKIALCHLLLKYDWKSVEDRDFPIVRSAFFADVNPDCRVIIRAREPEFPL